MLLAEGVRVRNDRLVGDRTAHASSRIPQWSGISVRGRDRAWKGGTPPHPPPARARLAAVASASNKKTLFQNVLASPAPYTAKWTPTATRPYFWNMALVRAA